MPDDDMAPVESHPALLSQNGSTRGFMAVSTAYILARK
jgi:hypothetical protein